MLNNIQSFRQKKLLRELNDLVRELLQVRECMKCFGDVNLPDYLHLINNVPEGVSAGLLEVLYSEQIEDYGYLIELKEKELYLKQAIQQASTELDELQ